MIIGRVTGYEIDKNKEGDEDSLLLQVELTESNDVQTVELYGSGGRDYNPPTDSTVVVIPIADALQIAVAVNDGIAPESEPGETEIYSVDKFAGEKQASVKCFTDGKVVLNFEGPAAARVGDEIQITPATDPALFAWINAVTAALGALGQPVAPAPLSATGVITSGSGTVEIGD
jgi:hypothetical protein